ncbi:hypothetical protein [Streptomyces sp. NPDC093109]|uniref:hypothetical protein n=1 Tax=Streptomyces sp. NPDC093109 TaxID=3154977 RepID=UPI00345041F3
MAITKIPDVVSHRTLLQALQAIRSEVESRQEDVTNLTAWSRDMATRMRVVSTELKALNVDYYTVGNVAAVADSIAGQARAATSYKSAADTSVVQAEVAARTAHRNHGRIQDAVANADVPMADNTFYSAE